MKMFRQESMKNLARSKKDNLQMALKLDPVC